MLVSCNSDAKPGLGVREQSHNPWCLTAALQARWTKTAGGNDLHQVIKCIASTRGPHTIISPSTGPEIAVFCRYMPVSPSGVDPAILLIYSFRGTGGRESLPSRLDIKLFDG